MNPDYETFLPEWYGMQYIGGVAAHEVFGIDFSVFRVRYPSTENVNHICNAYRRGK